MNLFKQKNNMQKSSSKLKFAKNSFFSKKRALPFIAIFGLLGGYLVFRSFAYTPLLNGSDGEFVPLAPARIMDTRNGNGGYSVALPANQTYNLQISGRGGVPDKVNVKSVVLSVVAVSPSAGGYLTAWPSGASKPNASNINFAAGQTIANQVTVSLGSDGKIQLFSSATVHIIVDVSGYYSTENGPTGTRFNSLVPARLLDTRNGTGGYNTSFADNTTNQIQITGLGGVPQTGVRAVVLNLVAVNPTAAGYATLFPAGASKPDASSINFAAGKTIAKLVTVPVGQDGKVSLYNKGGLTNYIVDVAGYYDNGAAPEDAKTQTGRFVELNPVRLMDTRNGNGGYSKALPANGTYSLQINGRGGVPTSNVRAVALNVVAVSPSTAGYLTVWPSGVTKPTASNLNFGAKETIANQVIVTVGSDGKIQLSGPASTNIIVDVSGYFIEYEDQYVYAANNISLWDMNGQPAKITDELSFDINLKELPTAQSSSGLRLSLQQYSYGSDYSNWRNHSLNLSYNPKESISGFEDIICTIDQDCRAILTPLIDTTESNGSHHLSFNYQINANQSYKLTRSIVTSQQGYEGRRMITSVTDQSGSKTELYTEKFEDGRIIESGLNLSSNLSSYDCNNPTPISYDIGNFLINGSSNYQIYWPSIYYQDYGQVNCAGYSKGYINEPAVSELEANNSGLSKITDLTQKSILGIKWGLPKAERDIKAPVISNLRQEVTTNMCYDGTKLIIIKYDVSDDNKVTNSAIQITQNSNYSTNLQQTYVGSRSVEASVCSLSASQTITVFAVDNSGNRAEQQLVITP